MKLEAAIAALVAAHRNRATVLVLRPTKLFVRPELLAECGLTIEDARAMVAAAERGRENPMKK